MARSALITGGTGGLRSAVTQSFLDAGWRVVVPLYIRVNAILPSVVDTPANRRSMPDADVTRWVAPAQIAAVVRFLCEDGSGVVSGAHVPVYGKA